MNSRIDSNERDQRKIHHIAAEAESNPYHRAAFPVKHRLARALWNFVWVLLYRTSPRPMHEWRSMLLRIFGAKMGPGCHFYPSGKVWAPWNLTCEDCCTLGDGAEIYNPSSVTLESHCILSQQAFLCGATHDYDDPNFPMVSYPMRLGAYSWICARTSVAPGVNVGEGAVLGLGSVATRDMEPWSIYSGNPAVKIRDRKRDVASGKSSA
jgi:putative colanic acid biosynthesis acetyltransferase WcaF